MKKFKEWIRKVIFYGFVPFPVICTSFDNGRCMGTKERELCSCGGDKNKCNFY